MTIYLGSCGNLSNVWIHSQLNEICNKHGGAIKGPLFHEPIENSERPISRWNEYDLENGRKLITDSFARDLVHIEHREFEDDVAGEWTNRLFSQFIGDFRIFCNWSRNPWEGGSGYFRISDSTFPIGRILINEEKYIFIFDEYED